MLERLDQCASGLGAPGRRHCLGGVTGAFRFLGICLLIFSRAIGLQHMGWCPWEGAPNAMLFDQRI